MPGVGPAGWTVSFYTPVQPMFTDLVLMDHWETGMQPNCKVDQNFQSAWKGPFVWFFCEPDFSPLLSKTVTVVFVGNINTYLATHTNSVRRW